MNEIELLDWEDDSSYCRYCPNCGDLIQENSKESCYNCDYLFLEDDYDEVW